MRSIRQVKGLSAELHMQALHKLCFFGKRKVEVLDAGAANRARRPRNVSESEGVRNREGIRVKPFGYFVRIGTR